jgi:putative acetyltransferase
LFVEAKQKEDRPMDREITVRRASAKDAAAYVRIMNHPQVQPSLLQLPFGDEAMWQARLSQEHPAGSGHLPLVAEIGGEVVGTAGVHPVGPALRRRHAMSLGIGVVPEAQGRGVGRALMQAICDYADRWAQVLRLELTVFADNDRAIALYRRFGFVEEGRHRGFAMRDGRYVDALAMARWHPSPPALVSAG